MNEEDYESEAGAEDEVCEVHDDDDDYKPSWKQRKSVESAVSFHPYISFSSAFFETLA